jgi:hypothetical protein
LDEKDAHLMRQHCPVYPLNVKEELINNVWYNKKFTSVYFMIEFWQSMATFFTD